MLEVKGLLDLFQTNLLDLFQIRSAVVSFFVMMVPFAVLDTGWKWHPTMGLAVSFGTLSTMVMVTIAVVIAIHVVELSGKVTIHLLGVDQ
jgi:hypothetical protein